MPDRLVALVHERAQGNPFFIEELLAAFIDKGVVSPCVANLRIEALDEFTLPRSIRSVVRERVGRLHPDAQDALILASILGEEFDLDVLVATSGRPQATVLNALDAALEKLLADRATTPAGLTRHFLQAGDTKRAATCAMQAGDHDSGRYAHAEAAQHYGVALELLRERGEARMAAEVQRRLASELQDQNRLPDAEAA